MTASRLLVGNCLDAMAAMPDASFDAVVTDPPFTAAGGSTNGRSGGHSADGQFFVHWLSDVFQQIRRIVKPSGCGFVFCDWRTLGLVAECATPRGNRQTEESWRVSQALVWDRESIGLGAPFRNSWEMIAFVRGPAYQSDLPKNLPNLIRCRWPYGRHPHHGAEKPVDLVSQLIRWALPAGRGHLIDPFAGSGTTLVAAARLGIDATGIEIDETNAGIAKGRLASIHVAEAPRGSPQASLWDSAARRDDEEVAP